VTRLIKLPINELFIFNSRLAQLPEDADVMRGKDVDGEDVVQVEALDEEPVEHGRASVLEQDVETLAQVRLKKLKTSIIFTEKSDSKETKFIMGLRETETESDDRL
jgi:hypothetical protein